MCGIIGIVDKKNCINDLISSLSRLEYRGYDSAGIATLNKNKFVLIVYNYIDKNSLFNYL